MMLAALAWRAVELWPIAAIVAVLVLAALLLLYLPQVRPLARRFTWLPPLLRGLAMATLAVSILRPTLIRTRNAEEQGAVVVLLDRSLSMSILDRSLDSSSADHTATIGELMALADGLERMPHDARSATGVDEIRRLASLVEDIARARRALEFARLSGRETRDAQLRLDKAIDDFLGVAKNAEQSIKSAAPRAVLDQLSRLARPPKPEERTRWMDRLARGVARAEEEALRSQSTIDRELYQNNDQARFICDEMSHLSRLGLCWAALVDGNGSFLGRLEKAIPVRAFTIGESAIPLRLRRDLRPLPFTIQADTPISDIGGGIAHALQQCGRDSLQAIVLFSDGRQVGGSRAMPVGPVPSGIPIFTVFAASPTVRDLAITGIDLPPSAFVNETIPLRPTVRNLNFDPGKISGDVEIAVGKSPAITHPFALKNDRPVQNLELPPIKLGQPGPRKIAITIPLQEGEAEPANNRIERWIKILEQKLKVAAISSSPTWDHRFLRNTLSRTSWIELREAVLSPGGSPLAMTSDEILEQDLLILNDIPASLLSAQQWNAIRRLVHDRGGSVIVIAGPALLREPPNDVLRSLLPWPADARPAWRLWPGQHAYYHVVAASGREKLPALRLDDDEETNLRRWDDLPGFFRYLLIPQLKKTAQPILIERDSQAPLLIEDRFGGGRVFFLGINETWRWRQFVGGRDQDRFWLQLVRYAMDEPYALSNGQLSFDIDRFQIEPEESVHVRARFIAASGDSPAPAQLEMALLRDGELYRTVPLLASGAAGAGRYGVTLTNLPAGTYELKLIPLTDQPAPEELVLPLEIGHSAEVERADLSGDREYLQRLAEASGGKCLNLDQVGALPQLLRDIRHRHPRATELHLWASPYLFIFVLCCLSVEWAVRKRLGLA